MHSPNSPAQSLTHDEHERTVSSNPKQRQASQRTPRGRKKVKCRAMRSLMALARRKAEIPRVDVALLSTSSPPLRTHTTHTHTHTTRACYVSAHKGVKHEHKYRECVPTGRTALALHGTIPKRQRGHRVSLRHSRQHRGRVIRRPAPATRRQQRGGRWVWSRQRRCARGSQQRRRRAVAAQSASTAGDAVTAHDARVSVERPPSTREADHSP